MRSVIVTGGTGFLGRATIRRLARSYERIDAFLPPGEVAPNEWVENPRIDTHTVDLLDPSALDRYFEGRSASALVHLAWYLEHGKYLESPANESWRKASVLLFERFFASGGRHVLAAGTGAEYSPTQELLREDTSPCEPVSAYGQAKLALFRELMEITAKKPGADATWARIFYPYGPGEPSARLIPALFRAGRERSPISRLQTYRLRDLIFVDDLAEGFMLALEARFTGAINVASGRATSLGEIVAAVSRTLGVPQDALITSAIEVPAREDTETTVVADVSRMKNLFGWHPATSLESGIRQTAEAR